jgi:tetratricopeptide (TPR) repeat protein
VTLRTTSPRHRAALFIPVLCFLMLLSCAGNKVDQTTVDLHKRLAGELRDTKLYRASIEEYQKLLDLPGLDNTTRANINYLVGKIYFENLADYEEAAAYYVRAREIDPEGSFVNEASKNLVTCLERMGQIVDARRQLDAATDIDAEPRPEGDIPVAVIGADTVWLATVEEQIQTLPADAQKEFASKEGKRNYVRQYVSAELLYRAAVREGFDKYPEILRKEQLLRKKLLVDKYILEKVAPEIKIDTTDVSTFYAAHKDDKYGGVPYDSVRAQVYMDYQSEKAEATFSQYITKLGQAESVQFLDQNVK